MKNIINKIKNRFNSFKGNNDGASIVEVILILVILIGIVLVFKTEITNIINQAFASIANDSQGIIH